MKINTRLFYYKNYYNLIDSHYQSYWIGKFTNIFIFNGHKFTVIQNLNSSFMLIKVLTKTSPIISFLEGIEQVKPLFGKSFVVIAGKRREFPKYLSHSKQCSYAVRWLKEQSIISGQQRRSLKRRLVFLFLSLRGTGQLNFIKHRDSLFSSAVKNRFNIRFTY